jgi:hypothetical protein
LLGAGLVPHHALFFFFFFFFSFSNQDGENRLTQWFRPSAL